MSKHFSQKGAIPLPALLGIVAILVFMIVIGIAPVKDRLLSDLFPKPNSNAAEGFVTRQGTKFILNGAEYKFVGFNLFDAANSYFPDQGKQGYSCPRDNGWWSNIYTETELDNELSYMKQQSGASVLRFWAYQQYTNGGTDWSGIDKVIRVAKKNGYKVIPVLEDGPGYCTQPNLQAKWSYNGDTWYTDGYKQKMGGYSLTYPDYVRAIVSRYKDEPGIFSWMMMNEADTSRKLLPDGTTKIDGNGPSVLVNFAKDIGSIIKGIDQNHLVTLGTQSNGASGASGKDFYDVYNIPELDYTEIHDWGYWADVNHDWRLGEQNPLPGSLDGTTLPNTESAECLKQYGAPLGCSLANAIQKLNKPVVMGEGGASTNRWSKEQRATLMDNKMKAFFDAGGAGYLVWQMNKVVDSEGFDVQVSTNDPLLAKMKAYASSSGSPLPSFSPTPIPSASLLPSPSVAISPSPSPAASLAPSIVPIAGNILQNPSFETFSNSGQASFSPWWLEIKSGGNGSITADNADKINGNRSAKITVTQTDDWWKVQIYQPNVGLVSGKTYKITFWAKASSARSVPVVLQKNASPYTLYLEQPVNITTSWQQYTLNYVSTVTDPASLFVFNLGMATGDIWFDNVSIAENQNSPVPGDIDGNGKVDIFDFNTLLTNFGKSGTGISGDLDGNGKVDIFDYNLLLTNFGK